MLETYKNIKRLRLEHGLTQEELAKLAGYADKTAISKIENGRIDLTTKQIKKFADIFGVSPSDIMGDDGLTHAPYVIEIPSKVTNAVRAINRRTMSEAGLSYSKVIPVYSRVAAGIPLEASGEIVDAEEIPVALARTGDYFGLRVQGDSMEPKISNGDTVIVRKQEDAESGELVVVLVNGHDATLKKLKKLQNGIMLISSNPAYDPIIYTAEDVKTLPVQIVGKVVELRAKL